MALRALGYARVLKDERTGRLVVDKTTLSRKTRISGEEAEGDFAGRRRRRRKRRREEEEDEEAGDDLGDEEAGDKDLGDEDVGDDDLGDEDAGDDDLGDEEAGEDEEEEAGEDLAGEEDLGEEVSGRKRRKARRLHRKQRRKNRRKSVKWGKTALSGESNTPEASGDQITINIRPQHWFKAQDITFTGDTSAKVDTIFFGDRPIWNNSVGTPVAVFAATGMLRGILNGQKIRPGLDIIIKGTGGTANTKTTATLIGYKPLNTTC
jgi:hypothetical protein